MATLPPSWVVALVERVRAGLRSLERKMTPPSFALMDFVNDYCAFQVVYALAELGVVDALRSGPRDTPSLAAELGVDEDHLYRLLRAATNVDVVRERADRTFLLRPMGRALCATEKESFRDYILFLGRVDQRFWGRLVDAVRRGKPAVEIETGKSFFEYMHGRANDEQTFNRAMTAVSSLSAEALVAAYDLSPFRTVVDVGGGHGRLLGGVLGAVAAARGVLFDLPEVVAGAAPTLETLGVRDRVEIVGGSFFDAVPAGGDLYILKSVIHDWQDDDAVRILGAVRKAAHAKSKVVLYEAVVPKPNDKHLAKWVDIEMMVSAGGRERTQDEYADLLKRAGFSFRRTVPAAGPLTVVEADAA